MANQNAELAVIHDFRIAKRYEGMDPELLAELQDQREDLDPESGILYRNIKIPSGGGVAYEVHGDDENDVNYAKELNAVIVFTHRLNAYWPGNYGSGEEKNKAPRCASMDGKVGLDSETGEARACEDCPLNQYGSAVDQQGNPASGKACKNMRRLYLLMHDDPNLYLLTIPPTSIRDVNKQLAKILSGGIPYTNLMIKFTLEKTQNKSGISYSKVLISKCGLLPTDIAADIQKMRQELKKEYQNTAVMAEDHTAQIVPDSATEPVYLESLSDTNEGIPV